MNINFQLHLGPLCPTLAEQLKSAKLKYEKEQIKTYQKLADALSILSVHSVINDAEKGKANHRLFMQIRKSVMKWNKLKPAPKKKAACS